MNWCSLILKLVFETFLKRVLLFKVKQRSLLIYLKSLQIARRSLIGLLAVFCFVQLLLFTFCGTLISAAFLFIEDPQQRLWVLFGGFAGLTLLFLMGIAYLFSERVWFEASGAREMMEKLGEK
ncbi:MAG: hypothetical protein KDD34_10115 [Bdellovibrionales bacterium]|nr:hypothetical protein [Bdellovibrionales bacterium]